jgi:hypothetical protein
MRILIKSPGKKKQNFSTFKTYSIKFNTSLRRSAKIEQQGTK